MSKIEDGGPAFPFVEKNDDGSHFATGNGATLRDVFAWQALAGLTVFLDGGRNSGNAIRAGLIAQRAYEYADAMLAERSKQ